VGYSLWRVLGWGGWLRGRVSGSKNKPKMSGGFKVKVKAASHKGPGAESVTSANKGSKRNRHQRKKKILEPV